MPSSAEHHFTSQIADLQRTAEARAQEIDTLRQRAEEAERKARDAENTATVLIRQTTNANQRAREAEAKAHERATQADQRATQADQRATQADQRAREADHRAMKAAANADQRAAEADERAMQADKRATQADQRAAQADQRAKQAEQRACFSQQQLEEAGLRIRETERRVQEALETARTAEVSDGMAETRAHDQYWVVHREEIQLTDRELGRGGWAVVREAKFRGLRVAAKCLHTFIISDYNRQLFVREMSIAARVRHPNLVQFIGSTMEGEPIILTELMATSLRAILERRSLTHTQVMVINLDVARALNYLHLMQPDPIIHRDVSSANVLLEPGPSNSWRAKVSDYGSANFLQQLTTAGPGNPTYASLEASIPSQQSPKMDVYSYGILLVEICSQRFPDLEEREALLQRVHQPAMVALIRQCLEQDPNGRPNMSEIVEQLER